MTREQILKLPIGTKLKTPFWPGTIVKLHTVETETAIVIFTEEYQGYAAGTFGRYTSRNLNFLTSTTVEKLF